jgi:hypothetical protein
MPEDAPPWRGATKFCRASQAKRCCKTSTRSANGIGTSTAAVQALAGKFEDQALSKKRGAEPSLQGSLAERLEFLVGKVSFHD